MNRNTLLLIGGAIIAGFWFLSRRRDETGGASPYGSSPFRSLSAGPEGFGGGPTTNVQTGSPTSPFFLPSSATGSNNALTLALAQAQAIGGAITAGGGAIRQVVEGLANFRNKKPVDPTGSVNANVGLSSRVEIDPRFNHDIGDGLSVNLGTPAESFPLDEYVLPFSPAVAPNPEYDPYRGFPGGEYPSYGTTNIAAPIYEVTPAGPIIPSSFSGDINFNADLSGYV